MFDDPITILADRFRAAIAAAFPQLGDEPVDPLIAAGRNPALGDFQSNAAMPLGKRLGMKPRDAALAIIERLDLGDIAQPMSADSVAGPGFINVRLRDDFLPGLLEALDTDAAGIEPPPSPVRVVVDLCGVNLAKQMHVGHLRSIIIGDAIARALARLGSDVVRQNHVGDWGLPIAMVTRKLMDETAAGRVDPGALNLDTLEGLYRAAQAECDADVRGLAAARRWWSHPKAIAELEEQTTGALESLARAKETLVRLQRHEPETFAVWKRISDVTMRECLAVCRRLHADVDADDSAGESSYAEELAGIVEDLAGRGVAEESRGALVVRNEGIAEPTIVRKSDGGYLYATTDLAAIRRRVQTLGADRVIYCVDARQSFHFAQVFAAAVKAGYATRPGAGSPASLEHAAFGTVLGPDNRPFKTRSGENVKLSDLLDEAHRLASGVVSRKSPELEPAERERVAETVAISAIKYADLSNERVRDYVFSFDRMLAFEGNTGPYLLYALVRMRSIFRNAAERGVEPRPASGFRIAAPEEKELALTLLRYPGVVRAVGASLEPHRLCQYLYDLAGAFSGFFTRCHVLNAEDAAARDARLRLCGLAERVLSDGLSLLGIPTLDRM